MHGSLNGNQGRWNATRNREGETRPHRCCARCKTPGFGCAKDDCRCHHLTSAPESEDTK